MLHTPPPQKCKQYGEIISEIAYLFLCSCINLNAIWKLKQICLGLTTNKYLVSSTLKTFVHQAYLRLDRSMKIERRHIAYKQLKSHVLMSPLSKVNLCLYPPNISENVSYKMQMLLWIRISSHCYTGLILIVLYRPSCEKRICICT